MKCKRVLAVALLSVVILSSSKGVTVSASVLEEKVASADVVHVHSGSQDVHGGCYTVETQGTKSEPTYGSCSPYFCQITYQHKGTCPSCGKENLGNYTFRDRHSCDTQWGSSYTSQDRCSQCGYSTSLSSAPSCGKQYVSGSKPVPYTYYSSGCGYTEDNVICGEVYLVKNCVAQYKLSLESDKLTIDSCTWSDGSTGTELIVIGDGTYGCDAIVSDGYSTYEVSLEYTVEDYDNEPPVLETINLEKVRCTSVIVEIVATDNFSGVEYYKLESSGR